MPQGVFFFKCCCPLWQRLYFWRRIIDVGGGISFIDSPPGECKMLRDGSETLPTSPLSHSFLHAYLYLLLLPPGLTQISTTSSSRDRQEANRVGGGMHEVLKQAQWLRVTHDLPSFRNSKMNMSIKQMYTASHEFWQSYERIPANTVNKTV